MLSLKVSKDLTPIQRLSHSEISESVRVVPVVMQKVNFLSSYWENILKYEPMNEVN
jgi:hypothetical protein